MMHSDTRVSGLVYYRRLLLAVSDKIQSLRSMLHGVSPPRLLASSLEDIWKVWPPTQHQ